MDVKDTERGFDQTFEKQNSDKCSKVKFGRTIDSRVNICTLQFDCSQDLIR